MQAILTVSRPCFSKYATCWKLLPVGTVVEITGQSPKTQRIFAKTENWNLCFMPNEATVEELEGKG